MAAEGAADGGSRLRGFDALRAIAVLLVVLSHTGFIEALRHPVPVRLFRVFNANFGVQLFFAISGFLITFLLLEERSSAGRISVGNFYARRALRILPAFVCALLFSAVIAYAGYQDISPTSFLLAAVYLLNFAPTGSTPGSLNHFWSLCVEEHFYLVWPLVFAAAGRRTGWLVVWLAAALALCVWWLVDPPAWMRAAEDTYSTSWWTVPAAAPVLLGCLLAIWHRQQRARFDRVFRDGSTIVVIGLLAALVAVALQDRLGIAPGYRTLLVVVCVCAIVGWVAANQRTVAVTALEWRPLVWIGTLSYGLYVWQGILTGNGPYRPNPAWPPPAPLGAFLTLAVAFLSYEVVERPLLRYKARFRQAKTRPDGASTA